MYVNMKIPSVYKRGYEKIAEIDPAFAVKYIKHTGMGDLLADAAVESLAGLPPSEMHRFINAGMEQNAELLAKAPKELRDFFEEVDNISPPAWFNPASERVNAGCRAFHADSDLFLLAFLADVIVRGFATMISKSFFMTGRIWDYGVLRLQRNILHLTEIMMPGGLDRQGEGWKLSVRIRIVHAQVRRVLSLSGDWDVATYGTPLSSAHIGLASCGFSAQLLKAAIRLGAVPSDVGRDGFMHIWRYTAVLMGVPEALLFRDEADALEIYRLSCLCEPPPDIEAVAMAHTLINSAPLVANITDKEERHRVVRLGYQASRALIGGELADKLQFPAYRTAWIVPWLRIKRRIENVLGRRFPERWGRTQKFMTLLTAVAHESGGISYELPEQVKSDPNKEW